MKELLILQMIAHLLADFIFQPEKWCKEKEENIFSQKFFLHFAIVLFCSFALSFSLSFWWAALAISISHLLIDFLKSCLIKGNLLKKHLFFIDQLFHFIVITVVTVWFVKCNDNFSLKNSFTNTTLSALSFLFSEKSILFFCSTKGLLIIFSFIFCITPANVLIKKVIELYEISKTKNNENDESLEKAGRIIGVLERCLTFVLILFGQYQAVGFIIAAKSILRFRDGEKAEAKTEYLLIGSLMSFGIAILLGIFCKEIIH